MILNQLSGMISAQSPLEMCVQWVILLGGASVVSMADQHTLCWQNYDNQAVICKHKCLYISHMAGFFFTHKHMSIYEYIKLHNVRLQVADTILLSLPTFSRLYGL